MNHIYRIVWNQVLNAWVAVAESARSRGKGSSRKLVAAALSLTASFAQAAPAGGQVVSGVGSVAQSGNTTTIMQSSQNLSLNWQSFNIARLETVNFVQPSASAIAVNRIFDTNGSQILGQLNANGQVYLINPNGILFGQSAQVNVGSLVASTLDLNDASLNSAVRSFSGTGTGSIDNRGTLNAAKGGYVALLGNAVSNQGTIAAPLGTVALGAGNAVTLNFNGDSLVKMQIDQSVLNSLAENGGLIQADGGRVVMNAGAKDALLASVVNNTGVIEARTVENHEGTIILLGGMAAGTVNVGGMLDAGALNGGNGGFIETSAAQVKIADEVRITTSSATGTAGHWLIDPVDFTIAASGGDITGANLGTLLASNSITIETATSPAASATNLVGSAGSNGDIHVNDAVNWAADNTLTLDAWRNININQSITATGTSGKLALKYGQGTADGMVAGVAATYNVNAAVNLKAGNNFSTQLGSSGTTKNYTVITSLGAQDSTTASDLQGMNGNLNGNYVLGSNIDATATSGWNSGAGFAPIGADYNTPFRGTLDGLGHTISNLTINRPTTDFVGLFGYSSSGAIIRNVGLIGGSVIGQGWVGALVGDDSGAISNSYSTANVTGINSYIGGLVGAKHYIANNNSTISNSYSAGSVTGGAYVGGLVGFNDLGTIGTSYATGSVSGVNSIGGLIGGNYVAPNSFGKLSNSYAVGPVVGSGTKIGALVGENLNTGSVINNFWDSTVNPTLAGIASGATTGATGLTTAQMQIAANFTGFNFTATRGATGNNWVMVNVDGTLNNANGATGATRPMLASEYSTTINNAHQLQLMTMAPNANYTLDTNVNAAATGLIGGVSTDIWGSAGFVPIGNSTSNFSGTFDGLGHTISNLLIDRPSASDIGLFGKTSIAAVIRNVGLVGGGVTGYGSVGALVGWNDGTITNSYVTGNVTGSNYYIGGLVGGNKGKVTNSYATGNVSGTGEHVGGLVGGSESAGSIANSYATGSVEGRNNVGGLLGFGNSSTSINNSYATGSTIASSSSTDKAAGGLVGYNFYGAINSSYWDSSIYVKGIGGGLTSGAQGLTTEAMNTMSSFSNWNIANVGGSGAVWRIYEGHTAPLLTSFMTGLTLADAPDVSVTYNGNTQSGSTSAHTGVLGTAATGTNAGFYNGYYSSQQGYDISGGNLTIMAAALSAISLSGTRVYDGTVDVAASIFTLSGLVSGQDLTLTGSGTVADKNVGSNKTVTLGSLTLGDGSSGLASNYTFTGGTQTATITKADLAVSGLIATDKVYDASNSATLSGAAFIAALGTDDVTLAGTASGVFADKNVGSAKAVTVSGNTITGTDAGNYNLQQQAGLTASISKADLAVSGLIATDKVYDASTSAALSGAAFIAALGTDDVTLAGTASGVFADKNVGGAKAVTVSGNTIAGTDAGNYNLQQQAGLTASISKAQLSYTASPVNFLNGQIPNDLYGTVNGFAAGDTLANSTSGHLTWTTPANASSQPGSYAVDGNGLLASNYSLSQAASNATALTLAPATPPTFILNATTQLASITASLQASAQPTVSSILPSILVSESNSVETAVLSIRPTSKSNKVAVANTSMTIGSTGPALQIVNGGMRLPVAMVNVND